MVFPLPWLWIVLRIATSCTNLIVTPSVSTTSATLISYAADSHSLYGALRHFPASQPTIPPEKYEVFDWDSGVYLGSLDLSTELLSHFGLLDTGFLNVVSNMNEFGVVVTETTFGGREELAEAHEDDILDYGNLIWLTLRIATSAREAIRVMGYLIENFGYASEGESITIGDATEAWVFEVIGKGKDAKGGVWVAARVPNGHVTAHANQARIRHFETDDPNNFLYSHDVISFATQKGYFSSHDLHKFSFADTYAPLTFEAARFCEARVWSFFNRVNPALASQYVSYAAGIDLLPASPLPWSIAPLKPLSVADVQDCMRDHFEGTFFDMTVDIGAQAFGLPYRWRPLTWSLSSDDKKSFVNERAIATQQTAFSLVAEPHPEFRQLGHLWFGVDDAALTVYFPVYVCSTRTPSAYSQDVDMHVYYDTEGSPKSRGGVAITTFSYDSAFWIFNLMSHLAYLRYNVIFPDIRKRQLEIESFFATMTEDMDRQAHQRIAGQEHMGAIVETLTQFSVARGTELFENWRLFHGELFAKYLDGDTKIPSSTPLTQPMPNVEFEGYSQEWYQRIVDETGTKLLEGADDLPTSPKAGFYVVSIALIQVLFVAIWFVFHQFVFPLLRR